MIGSNCTDFTIATVKCVCAAEESCCCGGCFGFDAAGSASRTTRISLIASLRSKCSLFSRSPRALSQFLIWKCVFPRLVFNAFEKWTRSIFASSSRLRRFHPNHARSFFHSVCAHLYSVQRWYSGLSFWYFSKRHWLCHVLVLPCFYHTYLQAIALS